MEATRRESSRHPRPHCSHHVMAFVTYLLLAGVSFYVSLLWTSSALAFKYSLYIRYITSCFKKIVS